MILGLCENKDCRKLKNLHKSKHTGKYVCVACHNKDSYYHKNCSNCGKKRKIAMRIVKKTYSHKCPSCGKKCPMNDKICEFCLESKPIESKEILYFCLKCSTRHEYRKQDCSLCSKKRHVHSRNKFDDTPICGSCYNKNLKKICSECGCPERIVAKNKDGRPIGVNCWQKARRSQKRKKLQGLTTK